jgi:outer membrane murein-binding lipoprotein Lpp
MVWMFRRGISVVVLLSFLSFLLYSCTGGARSPVSDDPDRLETALSTASELQELLAIRDEIAARAIRLNVTPADIRAAGSDARRANELLGLTADEAQARYERINALVGALYTRYPQLKDAGESSTYECTACDVESVAAAWEHLSQVLAPEAGAGAGGALEAPARGPLKCKWTQLAVGVGLCAVKSGGSLLFYTACSYGVFCGSCDGGIASVICPR